MEIRRFAVAVCCPFSDVVEEETQVNLGNIINEAINDGFTVPGPNIQLHVASLGALNVSSKDPLLRHLPGELVLGVVFLAKRQVVEQFTRRDHPSEQISKVNRLDQMDPVLKAMVLQMVGRVRQMAEDLRGSDQNVNWANWKRE